MSTKILVIENQVTQFETVVEKLNSSGYQTFPDYEGKDPGEFNRFMNGVAIWLNKNYSIERKEKALQKIKVDIEKWMIDLFIIDYKLSGSSEGFTGIDLALRLAAEEMFPGKPFIFLSRTPENTKDLGLEKLINIQYEWVEKGYSGRSLYENDYFTKYVIGAINKLLANATVLSTENETNKYRKMINELLKYNAISKDFGPIFKKLLLLKSFPSPIKEMLDLLHENQAWEMGRTHIKRIIEKGQDENYSF